MTNPTTGRAGLVEGQVAIIAGGASGIGRAVARIYAREGGQVLVADHSSAVHMVAADIGGDAKAAVVDMVDPAQVEAMVSSAVEQFGRVDAMISTVGITGVFADIVDMDPADFERIVRVNLTSAFLAIKYVVPVMRAGGGGAIVTFGSTGSFAATAGIAPYCASKAAIVLLTKTAALEYGRDNIRVNAVCPGPTNTPMTADLLEDPAARAALTAAIALDRVGTPDEVAEIAVMLASDRAAFVTGVAVPVDGGKLASADSRQIGGPVR